MRAEGHIEAPLMAILSVFFEIVKRHLGIFWGGGGSGSFQHCVTHANIIAVP